MSRFHTYFIGKFPKYRWYEKLWIQLKKKVYDKKIQKTKRKK